jgi:protein TonB
MIASAASISVYGQRTVTGQIFDSPTGKPISGASIRQSWTGVTTMTNALGLFQLQVDSVVSFEVEYPGYGTSTIRLGESTNFRIGLTKKKPVPDSIKSKYAIYERLASFPGGMKAFNDYVEKNIRTPKEVSEGRVSGKVLVEFDIDPTGQVLPDKIRIKEGLCAACEQEAIRLIRNSPRWNPGIQMDVAVGVRMTLPIVFK